jgi:hypothetical protein
MGALSLDASSPATVWTTATVTATTASFTPPAGSLLLIWLRNNGNAAATPADPTITDNLGVHLTYTLQAHNRNPDINAANGSMSLFTAVVATSAAMTVTTSDDNPAGSGRALKVQVWTDSSGVAPGVGTPIENATLTPITSVAQNITATVTGSRGVMGWADWDAGTGAPSAGAGCTTTGGDAANEAGLLSHAVILRTANDGVVGSPITMNLTTPSTQNARWIAIEVTPVSSTPEVGSTPWSYWPGDGPNPSQRFVEDPRVVENLTPDTVVTEVGTTAFASANTATITSASFTPANGTLLVAYCAMGNGVGSASSLGAVTDSLGGTWSRLGPGDASGTGGVAEIWARDITTGAAMTVTYDPGGAAASGLALICKWYSNAAPVASQPGATLAGGGDIAYAGAIAPTTPGSLIAGALGRAFDAQAVTANANTTLFGYVNGTAGDTAALFAASGVSKSLVGIVIGLDNPPGGNNRISLAEILPTIPGGGTTNAPAESTLAAGSAADAAVSLAANAEAPGGAGAAADATPAVGAGAEATQGVGSAADATVAVTAAAESPTGTGAAADATSSVAPNAESALAAGAAYDATVSTASSTNAPAEATTGTGSAADAVAAVAVNAEAPSGVGSSADATTGVAINAEATLGVGTAYAATAAAASNAATASGAGVAADAAVSATVDAASATGAAAAADGSAAVGVAAAQADAVGTAADAAVAVAASADAPAAAGTASDAVSGLATQAQAPAATGSAADATVAISGTTNAPADAALGTGAAADASAAVTSQSGVATAAGSAADATVSTSASTAAPAGFAAATGSASDATVAITVGATAAAGTGAVGQVTPSVEALADQAEAVAAAWLATISSTVAAQAAEATGAAYDATTATPGRITVRPASGVTVRPASGVTVRPGAGATTPRPGGGITVRPDTGVTSRP